MTALTAPPLALTVLLACCLFFTNESLHSGQAHLAVCRFKKQIWAGRQDEAGRV
jgi:hypothetical protein